MFKSIFFLLLAVSIITAKINVEIVESVDSFKVLIINSGANEVPIAGYRLLAEDTLWDSVRSEKDIYISNYEAGDELTSMGIYGTIHQINFKNPESSVLGVGDTFLVTYYDLNIEQIPNVFDSPYSLDVVLSSVILRGYKDRENKQLTSFDSLDILSPEIQFLMPVYYRDRYGSDLVGEAFDTSGILELIAYNDSNWQNLAYIEDYYSENDMVEFGVAFDHYLSFDKPGWLIAYDSSGNGTVLELRADISPIEDYTYRNNSHFKVTSAGKNVFVSGNKISNDMRLEMVDLKGRVIYSKDIELGVKEITIPVNSRCISSGLYFVKLSTENYSETFKINIR